MISAVILVANIYNLILIYQQTQGDSQQTIGYQVLAIVDALVLIVTTVLAWGQPGHVLLPAKMTWWPGIFLGLNTIQALLGGYFVTVTRPQNTGKLSLFLGPIDLLIASLTVPACLTTRWWLVALTMLIMVNIIQIAQIPSLFVPTPANRSMTYRGLLGMNLASSFGGVLLTMLAIKCETLRVSLPLCTLLTGLSDIVIAAMQRYNNDYRYGHASKKHQQLLCAIGAIIFVLLILMVGCFQTIF